MRTRLSTRDFLTLVFSVLALMSVAACGPLTGSLSPSTGASNLEGEIPVECLWTPDQGDSVNLSLAGDNTVQDSGFFEKKIFPNRYEPLMSTSILATVEFAKASGLNLYRVIAGSTHCDLFRSVESAPAPQQGYWDKASRHLPEGVSLLGLFLSSDPGEENYEVGKVPTILVNAGADRWTLVHEMMHANFNKARRLDQNFRNDTEVATSWTESAKKLFNRVQKDDRPIRDEEVESFVKEFTNLAADYAEFQKRFALEEISIESILLKAWSDGKLKYHASKSPKNGMNYIRMKRIEIKKDLSDLSSLVEGLIAKNSEFRSHESFMKSAKSLDQLKVEVDLAFNRSEKIYSEKEGTQNVLAGFSPANQLMNFQSRHEESSMESSFGCSHGSFDQASIDEAFGRIR